MGITYLTTTLEVTDTIELTVNSIVYPFGSKRARVRIDSLIFYQNLTLEYEDA